MPLGPHQVTRAASRFWQWNSASRESGRERRGRRRPGVGADTPRRRWTTAVQTRRWRAESRNAVDRCRPRRSAIAGRRRRQALRRGRNGVPGAEDAAWSRTRLRGIRAPGRRRLRTRFSALQPRISLQRPRSHYAHGARSDASGTPSRSSRRRPVIGNGRRSSAGPTQPGQRSNRAFRCTTIVAFSRIIMRPGVRRSEIARARLGRFITSDQKIERAGQLRVTRRRATRRRTSRTRRSSASGRPKDRHSGLLAGHNMSPAPSYRAAHRRQEPIWTSVRGAGVKCRSAPRTRGGPPRQASLTPVSTRASLLASDDRTPDDRGIWRSTRVQFLSVRPAAPYDNRRSRPSVVAPGRAPPWSPATPRAVDIVRMDSAPFASALRTKDGDGANGS